MFPPFRFSAVELSFYRGAYPTLPNYRFLQTLNLKTIISIIPEPPISDLLEFCDHQTITNVHIRIEKPGKSVKLTPSLVVQFLELVICPQRHPLYIHCLDGTNVTGLFVCCLRKLQNWESASSFAEFCRFSHDRKMHPAEMEFIERFNNAVALPDTLPNWLWQGRRVSDHPSFPSMFSPSTRQDTDREEDESNHDTKRSCIVYNDTLLCLKVDSHLYLSDPSPSPNLQTVRSETLQALCLEGLTINPQKRHFQNPG
jgi:tyrosine-protein phosphatase OCA6